MTLSSPRLLQRRCRNSEIGVDGTGNGRAWPTGEVLLASVARPDTTHWLLTIPQAVLAGEALTDFLGLVALAETGPGLCPVLAWQSTPVRRFLSPDERAGALAEAGVTLSGVADGYLGLGLLLLANPDLAASWQTLMSLGGVTKIRKITGREFPVWVDLPDHQPALLASPVL